MRLAAVLILALAMPAAAVPVVDQEALPNGGTYWTDGDTATVQSFTVGQSGMLTRIDIWFEQDLGACSGVNDGCSVTIADGTYREPDGSMGTVTTVLAESFTVESDEALSGWIAFEMRVAVSVVEGQTLSFNPSDGELQGLGRSDYAGGYLTHVCNSHQCVDPLLGHPFYVPDLSFTLVPGDLAFRVWIEPASVPEPSVLSVVGGLLCAFLFRRLRP